MEYKDEHRRTGRSTRLIDSYIQELFEDGYIRVADHHCTRQSDQRLFKAVMRRLAVEHPLLARTLVRVNRSTFEIRLVRPGETKENLDMSEYLDPILYSNASIKLTFWDKLSVLFTGEVLVDTEITPTKEGETASHTTTVTIRNIFGR